MPRFTFLASALLASLAVPVVQAAEADAKEAIAAVRENRPPVYGDRLGRP